MAGEKEEGASPRPEKSHTVALADRRTGRGMSRHTVTVIGNNFLLCHGIYMQIDVSNAHLPLPTINHDRLAHQFLNIIRSYRQGCNIIFNTATTLHIQLLSLLPETTALAVIWGAEWVGISEQNVPA